MINISHSLNNFSLSIATVPTSSQTSPPAILATSAISRVLAEAAYTTAATAISSLAALASLTIALALVPKP